jgi:hypothetical protein
MKPARYALAFAQEPPDLLERLRTVLEGQGVASHLREPGERSSRLRGGHRGLHAPGQGRGRHDDGVAGLAAGSVGYRRLRD